MPLSNCHAAKQRTHATSRCACLGPLSGPYISSCAGYFSVKPTECHECRSRDIKDIVVKTQALEYITLGKVDSALAWR